MVQEQRTLSSTLLHLADSEVWEDLRPHMAERSYTPGDCIVEQGELNPDFHVISDGVVSVSAATPGGDPRELSRLGFGECVGEMSLLTGDPASANVTAVTPVKTYAIRQEGIGDLGPLRARLIEALSTILAARLRHANERLLAMHSTNIHVICCASSEFGAFRQLPDEIARVTGSPAAVVLWSAEAAAHRASFGTDRVRVEEVPAGDAAATANVAALLARDFEHVLVLGEESSIHGIAAEARSMLHVIRADGRQLQHSAHASLGQLVALSPGAWTQPTVRHLSTAAQRPVVAIVPAGSDDSVGRAQVSRLARLMTGRKVGIAFGAGAAKGMAHLGVIRALEDLDVPTDVVSGCSIGSAIAAGVAAGLSIDELTETTFHIAGKAVRPTLPIYSFLSNRAVKEELKKVAGDRRIEDLDLPLALVAVDIFRRSEVTFTRGLVWPRILASMAIPGIYPPSKGRGSYLADGGILNPVPVRQCRELGADIVIGVRLTGIRTSPRDELEFEPKKPLAIESMIRAFEMMQNRISEVSRESADINLEVSVEGSGGVRDFQRGPEIAEIGYQSTMEAVETLSQAMPYAQVAGG